MSRIVQVLLHRVEDLPEADGEAGERHELLRPVVAAHEHALLLLDVLRPELEAHRHPAHLPARVLVAHLELVAVVEVDAHTRAAQHDRRLARWELGIYQSSSRLAPDLAVKLDISPQVAISRKPDMALAECASRRAAVAQLDWGPRCRHLVIDAEQPLEKVLLEVKRAIWAVL